MRAHCIGLFAARVCPLRLPPHSRCHTQGAQGEVTHCTRTGAASAVEFKNVELGVLFHSSPERAYHAPPPPDCACRTCRRRRRRIRRAARGPAARPPSTLPLLTPLPPETAREGAVDSFTDNVAGHLGLADERAAAGSNARGPHPPARRPRAVPLPVPFCLDSEPYADPEGESPHARFAPFMHTLINQRPW